MKIVTGWKARWTWFIATLATLLIGAFRFNFWFIVGILPVCLFMDRLIVWSETEPSVKVETQQ